MADIGTGPAEAASPDRPDQLGRVARGVSWTLIGQLLPVGVTVFFTPFVLHHLGVVRYGLFVLTGSLTSLLGTFDGGIRATAQRYFGVYAGEGDVEASTRLLCTLLVLVLCGGALLSALGLVLAGPLVALVHVPHPLRPEATYLFRTLGALIAFDMVHNLFVALLQAHGRYATITRYGFAVYGIWVVGLTATVLAGWGLRGVADVFLGQAVFLVLTIMPAALAYVDRSHAGFVSRPLLSEVLHFGRRVQLSSLSVLINDRLDAVVVGAVRSARTVALYNAGTSFAENIGALAVGAVGPAQTAMTSALGADGPEAAGATFLRLQRFWVLGVTGVFTVAGSAAWWAITAWLGPAFRLGGTVAVIACVGTALYALPALLRTWCVVAGEPGVQSRAGVASVVVNLAATVPLAVVGGAVGVAVATAVGQLAGAVVLVRSARRHLDPATESPLARVPLAAAAVAAAVTAGGEIAIAPVVPGGGLGLLVCGLPAVVGLAAFLPAALGVRPALGLATAVVRRARGGPWQAPAWVTA